MTHRTRLRRVGPWLPHLGAVLILAVCFVDGARIYGSLPDTVPVHWGLNGPDAWDGKSFWDSLYGPVCCFGNGLYSLALVSAAAPALSPALVLSGCILAVMIPVYAAAERNSRREAARRGIHPTDEERADDAKWIGGILLNDPRNPHVLVPKRNGTGTGLTVNVGNVRGRTAVVLFLIVVIVLPVGLGVLS